MLGSLTHRIASAAVIALVAAAAAPAAAMAVTITFVPPPGAHVDTTDTPPQYFRTADRQPTIGIQADGGAQMECSTTLVPQWGPCGPPLPGCNAALCASYRPAAPLTGVGGYAEHNIEAQVLDASGNVLAHDNQFFTADFTPPVTNVMPDDSLDPFRPGFTASVSDDEYGDPSLVTDRADCSLRPLGAPPSWTPCVAPGAPSAHVSYRLARRHVDYRFQVRGTDDFGRSTIAHFDFDPVPCSLSVRPPRNLAAVVSSGIAVSGNCSYTRTADVGLFPVASEARRYGSPQTLVSNGPLIGHVAIHSRRARFSFHRQLRMFASEAPPTRLHRWVRFLITVCPSPECLSLTPDMSYTQITVRR